MWPAITWIARQRAHVKRMVADELTASDYSRIADLGALDAGNTWNAWHWRGSVGGCGGHACAERRHVRLAPLGDWAACRTWLSVACDRPVVRLVVGQCQNAATNMAWSRTWEDKTEDYCCNDGEVRVGRSSASAASGRAAGSGFAMLSWPVVQGQISVRCPRRRSLRLGRAGL